MVNGIHMRISNISLIIYCTYRYIFMAIWRMWGEEASDSRRCFNPLKTFGAYITNFFRELVQSFAYLCLLLQDQEKVDGDDGE